MRIHELTEQDRPAWDAYVCGAPHGLPQHLSGWRNVMARTYGYATHFLLARRGDGAHAPVAGIMPLFVVASMLTGRTLTTMPGGMCADDDDTARALLAHAQQMARRIGARQLVLQDTRQAWPGSWRTTSDHVSWRVDLSMGEEALWQKLDRNIRRQVRMAQRNELSARVDRTGVSVGDFHGVLSRFTHQAGTPVFGRNFLEQIVAEFPDAFNIVIVYHQEQPIGGYFQMTLGTATYGLWGATLHEFLPLRPVYLAYWTILTDAIAHGCTCLDMGRSPAGANSSEFKRQWGGTMVPIYQQVASSEGGEAMAGVTERVQSHGRFRSFRQIWPKLPLPLTQFLGPKLRRHAPFA